MFLAHSQIRDKIAATMRAVLELDIDESLKDVLHEWLEFRDNGEESARASSAVITAIEEMNTNDEIVTKLCDRIMWPNTKAPIIPSMELDIRT